ncbi:MAG: hypothetical protein AMXMBFR13_43030 [Phycisphaerae bacterium]
MRLQIRLLLETFALTALIWTYADQAGFESWDGTILVKVSAPQNIVVRIKGPRGDVQDSISLPLKLRGPKSAIRRLEQDRGAGGSPLTLTLTIREDLETQTPHTRDVRDEISRLPAIRDRGLQVADLPVQAITFTLDRYVGVTLDVDTDPGVFTDDLVSKPEIRPRSVVARVLESELQKLGTREPRHVVSIEEAIRTRADESSPTFNVSLGTKWQGIDATFKPEQVRVTVRLAKLYEQQHLTLIPLQVLPPPGTTNCDFEIEYQTDADLVQDIDVRVPIGKTQALINADVWAVLPLEKSDIPGAVQPNRPTASAPAPTEGWTQREIRFIFPQGFEDVRLEGLPRIVKFRVKQKTTTPGLLAPLEPLP